MSTRSSESTFFQALLKSRIRLKITFSNSVWLKRTKKKDKSSFLQTSRVFGSRQQVHCKKGSETSPVMHLNKHISRSLQLRKYLSYEALFFFKTLEIYRWLKKCKIISQKIYGFSDSLIYVGNRKFSLLIREYS